MKALALLHNHRDLGMELLLLMCMCRIRRMSAENLWNILVGGIYGVGIAKIRVYRIHFTLKRECWGA
jgi:hypothetical protein